MKNFIFCFIISIGIHWAAVFATQFDDEWKQTCRNIIGKLAQVPPKSEECGDEVNENLNALAREVDKIYFLCLTNEYKPNCEFNKSNSHFLYSLNEAIKNCHEQNVAQNSADNGQNANLAFLQQFNADFNTLVMEIELLIDIGESDLSEMSKEKVEGQRKKLAKLQNDFSKNQGHYNDFKQMLQKLAVKTLEKVSELNADNKLHNSDQFQNAFTITSKR
ncbi:hypothetical protein niasHT_020361 [Heterodera trifolii]|uniref:Secreted protein n=1 Tax=Heterodera trifolii TaxID=157864 RepID=A0ABD2JX39_9BILA